MTPNQVQGLLDELDTLLQEQQIIKARERINCLRSQITQADVTQVPAE